MDFLEFVALADDSMLPDLPEETPRPKYDESKQLGLVDADLVNDNTTNSQQTESNALAS